MLPLSLSSVHLWCCTVFSWSLVQRLQFGELGDKIFAVMWSQKLSLGYPTYIAYDRALLPDVGFSSSHHLHPSQNYLFQALNAGLRSNSEAMWEDELKNKITIDSNHQPLRFEKEIIQPAVESEGKFTRLFFFFNQTGRQAPIFASVSHQTRLDTRSKARRPIKEGIKGRGRSGTSRNSNPAAHPLTWCNVSQMSQAVSRTQMWVRVMAWTKQQGLVLYIGSFYRAALWTEVQNRLRCVLHQAHYQRIH